MKEQLTKKIKNIDNELRILKSEKPLIQEN